MSKCKNLISGLKKLAFLPFLIIVCGITVEAQTKRVAKAIEKIPSEGRTAQDFVPKGWEIYTDSSGDLNGDNLSDAALTLTLPFEEAEKLRDGTDGDYESAPSIVVVLFAKKGGGFRRFAVNGRLYPSDSDTRSYLTPKIAKGVLIVNNNWGDGWAVDTTFRFRYDAAADKLMLIGFDLENYSRMSIYEGEKTSENYLSGVRIDYDKSAKRKASDYSETQRSQIKREKISFEKAWLNEGEGDHFQLRPF